MNAVQKKNAYLVAFKAVDTYNMVKLSYNREFLSLHCFLWTKVIF